MSKCGICHSSNNQLIDGFYCMSCAGERIAELERAEAELIKQHERLETQLMDDIAGLEAKNNTKDRVIKELLEKCGCKTNPSSIDIVYGYSEQVRLLKCKNIDLEAQLVETEWVSVQDRMPDDETEVLVIDAIYNETILQMDICNGRWRNECGQFVVGNPSHWMPLPHLPKPKKESKQ